MSVVRDEKPQNLYIVPLTGVNEEVQFVPHVSQYLYLDYSSVTDNHWKALDRTERKSVTAD